MNEESKMLRVSVRGWLAILMTFTVCLMSGLSIEVTEPLKSMVLFAIGFYFAQKTQGGKS